MDVARIENRPYPYVVTDADLLRNLKESAAEGLFKSFELLLGKDARENGVRFEALLGVYTNAVQYVKFLETSLAISCLNTEFKDLRRMTDGKIQFRISVPTIAHGDGRRPRKQRQYLVLKTCHKHRISTEMELSTLDLELLFMPQETALDVTEYMGAVKTITSAIQFGVDALERGLIDTTLTVKIRHAPPLFILKSLSNPTYLERGAKKSVKADLVAMFKNRLIEDSFFLDKAEQMQRGRQYTLGILTDLVSSVTSESVLKGLAAYTTATGEPIAGVFETTDAVMRRLLSLVGRSDATLMGPTAYAKYIVRGENLVTAISYGRVMRHFDQFLARLVDKPTQQGYQDESIDDLTDGSEPLQRAPISATLLQIGTNYVALESLQRVYNEAQFPFPLNRRMQYSYYFPVGLYQPSPLYTTSGSIRGVESPLQQPIESWVVNKNNVLLCFNYQNALKSLCHPRMHNPIYCAQALRDDRRRERPAHVYGTRFEPNTQMNVYYLTYSYYFGKNNAFVPDVAAKCLMDTDAFLHPSNALLRNELHPLFDFYEAREAGGETRLEGTHRNFVGNMPTPLTPKRFHECRGAQFENAAALAHVVDGTTLELVQDTAFDAAYPPLYYVVEAMIHGQEEKFTMNAGLVALCINDYWERSGRLAFINSFWMLRYICTNMPAGTIAKEAFSHYRRLYGELVALHHALVKIAGSEEFARRPIGEYLNALLDPNMLPPVVYHDEFSRLLRDSNRKPVVYIGTKAYEDPNDVANNIVLRGTMADEVQNVARIYRDRFNEDFDHREFLDLAPLPPENTLVLEKLYYYVLLPVCTRGHMCGVGVDFDNIAVTLGYNAPVFSQLFGGNEDALAVLERGTMRRLLEVSDIRPSVAHLRRLVMSYLTCPFTTQVARVVTTRDPGQVLATSDSAKRVGQTVLVNGILTFAMPDRARDVTECLFYPAPTNKLYSDPLVAATLHPVVANFIATHPTQRDAVQFNVPPTLMAEYQEWHKSGTLEYFKTCEPTTTALSAAVAMHDKLSPVAFVNAARTRVHPGMAMTVVRTDEVLAENILFSARSSTSMFIGTPVVTRREARVDAVTFEINHELASLDMGLGYSSIVTPAHAAAITTDMGVHCQDLFALFPSESFPDRDLYDYLRRKVGSDRGMRDNGHDVRAFVGAAERHPGPPGLCNGQLATCEVIPTPVVADVSYFQTSNSPRGRASCVVSCDAFSTESAERYLYDHSIPDPAYEYRATVNPWASQIGSLGDILYNSGYRQMTTPGLYSPCRQFFSKDELLRNNRSLYTLVSEYAGRLNGAPATSATDVQYVVINGTDVFLEQPCLFLQEAFPTLCASHRVMLDEYMSNKATHAPVHMNQYLIEETAPLKRLLKQGNKIVY